MDWFKGKRFFTSPLEVSGESKRIRKKQVFAKGEWALCSQEVAGSEDLFIYPWGVEQGQEDGEGTLWGREGPGKPP